MKASIKPSAKRSGEEILTVDAGVTGTGLAFWNAALWGELTYPRRAVNIYSREGDWLERTYGLAAKFEQELVLAQFSGLKVVNAFIEWPSVFDSTARSQAAAKKGDIGKLFFLCGMYAQILRRRSIPCVLVPVNDWIGQIPKPVNVARILKRLPKLDAKSHAIDATGLGLHLKGFLNNE